MRLCVGGLQCKLPAGPSSYIVCGGTPVQASSGPQLLHSGGSSCSLARAKWPEFETSRGCPSPLRGLGDRPTLQRMSRCSSDTANHLYLPPSPPPPQVAQHRDIIQNEYARVNLAKSKLENLCRELQRHSKAVAVSQSLYCLYCMFPS